ncbi:MAG: alpha-amylase [Lachnospiraceae bacterium]|nr:alpha-amylase [Lachnospiraceae bacterium]
MENKTIIQFFEWYLPSDGTLWEKAAACAADLKNTGITSVWLPPAYKGAAGAASVGYDVYDPYDLGEFDQKGSVRTKYGTRDQYLTAVRALHDAGLEVYADIVFNQMMGADETEKITAVDTKPTDREEQISGPHEIEAWTKFTFPGRSGKYSDHTWDKKNFSGTDFDQATGAKGIFLFDGKRWNQETDSENVNFDYLMGVDLDTDDADTYKALTDWGSWYFDTVHPDGLRLDAVKHMSFDFYRRWLRFMREREGRDFFAVGEYWSGDLKKLLHYLDVVVDGRPERTLPERTQNPSGSFSQEADERTSAAEGTPLTLFDVPLHYSFLRAAQNGQNFDMQSLFTDTLVEARPECAVTFIDNHDTEPGQALESYIPEWFKPIAYSMILLRENGIPCIFYGDYYGVENANESPILDLKKLIRIRSRYAYGPQTDYFDDHSVVGFTRSGDSEHPDSGLAVLATAGAEGTKYMALGPAFAGKTLRDALGRHNDPVRLDEQGGGVFHVHGGYVSVWLTEPAYQDIRIHF